MSTERDTFTVSLFCVDNITELRYNNSEVIV